MNGIDRRAMWLLLAWTATSGCAASAEGNSLAVLGELVLPYDNQAWTFEGGGSGFTLSRKGEEYDRNPIDISVSDDPQDQCTPQSMIARSELSYEHAWERHSMTISRQGFDLHLATIDMGCRNWTGSPVFACAAYRQKTYFFTADPGGCDTPPNYDGPVIELLRGLRLGG